MQRKSRWYDDGVTAWSIILAVFMLLAGLVLRPFADHLLRPFAERLPKPNPVMWAAILDFRELKPILVDLLLLLTSVGALLYGLVFDPEEMAKWGVFMSVVSALTVCGLLMMLVLDVRRYAAYLEVVRRVYGVARR